MATNSKPTWNEESKKSAKNTPNPHRSKNRNLNSSENAHANSDAKEENSVEEGKATVVEAESSAGDVAVNTAAETDVTDAMDVGNCALENKQRADKSETASGFR